ncbi:MAG: acyltransferase [Psychrobacter sp.]|uniref:acyltransferase n=1 Tax=unclassified Psychrobacter TaxID=196806 RepID=UPI001787DEEB|nr:MULTISPECIES: acyltransferase [unclassified Psychrobacter]MBE0442706.1 acyltransferase [Psychrobacter sp. FME13]
MNPKKTITLSPIIKAIVPKQLYKRRFLLQDKGHSNHIDIASDAYIVGDSAITIRKGHDNQITIGKRGKFNRLKIDINGNHNHITIAEQVKFSGQLLIVGNHLHIHIGERTTAIDCYILARDKSVSIGNACMISRGIEIRATDVHKVYDMNADIRINTAHSDVVLGDHIWIAANVTISKNVSIASGCIIAAGSFVNKPVVTPNCMVAGTPAKVIRQNIRWER